MNKTNKQTNKHCVHKKVNDELIFMTNEARDSMILEDFNETFIHENDNELVILHVVIL
jgi:glucan phosphoethanolaminetransferase (alkaline phosphatase superfamily)